MNKETFNLSLLNPQQVGDQFEQSTKDIVENVTNNFFNINQQQHDGSINGSDVTEHIRKKHKHEVIMDETVSTIMTTIKCY